MKIKRALLSVSDKTGIVELGKFLSNNGVEIISTGGTMKALREAGVPVTYVSDVTGFPEIMDGRVKTLNPKIHGAILAVRSNPEHMEALAEHNITPIDLVVVNLYPFRETIAKPGVTEAEAIENIDIGGPAMVRASVKKRFGIGDHIPEINDVDIPKLAHYADKEANPLYPVPVLMDSSELEGFYYRLMDDVQKEDSANKQ